VCSKLGGHCKVEVAVSVDRAKVLEL
jgi:hypothetical protein